MNLKNKDIKYTEYSLMVLLTGTLIYAIGVMVEKIFNIAEVTNCGIIIIGVGTFFICIFIWKEF